MSNAELNKIRERYEVRKTTKPLCKQNNDTGLIEQLMNELALCNDDVSVLLDEVERLRAGRNACEEQYQAKCVEIGKLVSENMRLRETVAGAAGRSRMEDLLNEVRASVFMEYERAKEKFGPANNSPHESYAVILEEFEEAEEQSEIFRKQLDCFWNGIKTNNPQAQGELITMQFFAMNAAAEWIQVAAMCYKATKIKQCEEEGKSR